jgi:succinate dehydrogenase / fumarate reductase membrane anchor subunit
MAVFHWKLQRISAIILVPTTMYISIYLLNINNLSYLEVISDITSFSGIFLLSFVSLVLFTHSSLGIETILEDYVHEQKLQNLFVNISKFFHVILFLLTIGSLIMIKGI